MRQSRLLVALLAAALTCACGACSNLGESLSGASSTTSATTGAGGATTGAGGATTGAGGATTGSSSSASTGAGGAFPGAVWSQRRAGTLAWQPLAVDGGGHIWLFGGQEKVEDKWPSVWKSAHLWKLSPKGDAEIDATIAGGDGIHLIPSAIRADAAGGVLLAGTIVREPGAATTLDIGGKALSLPFAASAFIVKLDAGGQYVFSRVYDAGVCGDGSGCALSLWNIDADAAGRWYILGYLAGSADLGSGQISGQGQTVLVLSPTGDHVTDWLLPLEGGSSMAFVVEPSGHLWLGIGFSGACSDNLHMRRFDPAGNLLVDTCLPGACFGGSLGMALDGAGGIFVTDASGDDYCGPDDFLRRVDASGNVTWTLHGSSMMYSTTVATAPAGHVLMGGSFYQTFDLGGGPLASAASTDGLDVVVGDVGADGMVGSVARYGGVGDQRLVATALDPLAARVIAGQFSGVVDFGDGPQQSLSDNPDETFFVARIQP